VNVAFRPNIDLAKVVRVGTPLQVLLEKDLAELQAKVNLSKAQYERIGTGSLRARRGRTKRLV